MISVKIQCDSMYLEDNNNGGGEVQRLNGDITEIIYHPRSGNIIFFDIKYRWLYWWCASRTYDTRADGKIGIGTTDPDATLDVVGDVKVSGNLTGNVTGNE